MRKLKTKLMFVLAAITLLGGCNDSSSSNNIPPANTLDTIDSITLNKSEVSLNISDTIQIEFDYEPPSGNLKFELNFNSTIISASVLHEEKIISIKGLISGITTLSLTEKNSGKFDSIKVVVNESEENPGIYNNDIENEDNIHYLDFMISEELIARLVVLPDDTYESLEPYFPSIRERQGYNAYWEKITNVYLFTQYVIRINAYYELIL